MTEFSFIGFMLLLSDVLPHLSALSRRFQMEEVSFNPDIYLSIYPSIRSHLLTDISCRLIFRLYLFTLIYDQSGCLICEDSRRVLRYFDAVVRGLQDSGVSVDDSPRQRQYFETRRQEYLAIVRDCIGCRFPRQCAVQPCQLFRPAAYQNPNELIVASWMQADLKCAGFLWDRTRRHGGSC